MRRSLADSILKAFEEHAEKNLPADMPDNTPVQLLVRFSLGDIRSLKRSIDNIDEAMPRAARA